MFECCNLLAPMECNFLRLIYNKVTSRSYGYFLKISYFHFLSNWYFQLCQKLQSLVQKTQGILGVKAHYLNKNRVPPTWRDHPIPKSTGENILNFWTTFYWANNNVILQNLGMYFLYCKWPSSLDGNAMDMKIQLGF
jgi:hypothetical protein